LTTRENGQVARWTDENRRGFHFGIEAEYLLVDADTFRPLWHHDLTFEELNAALETISVDDLPSLDGLELEPPHTKLMPFVVEGYHLPSPEMSPRDLLPKGIEIRTPVCPSIGTCLESLRVLHERMQDALGELGAGPVSRRGSTTSVPSPATASRPRPSATGPQGCSTVPHECWRPGAFAPDRSSHSAGGWRRAGFRPTT
jgi:hypothetical protein